MPERTALVLSAGGMFCAWQAGAWSALAESFHPDVIIGVSAGALNAWAIAAGSSPDELARFWLDRALGRLMRLRFPWPPWAGCFCPDGLIALAERLAAARPKAEIWIGATELRRLRPRLFPGPEVTWRHLFASCAVPFCLPPMRIEGTLYVDGGLLGALPLWALSGLHVRRAIALQALPKLPCRPLRAAVRIVQALAPPRPEVPETVRLTLVTPSGPLGSVWDSLFWRRQNIEQWIEMGRSDARRAFAKRNAEPLA